MSDKPVPALSCSAVARAPGGLNAAAVLGAKSAVRSDTGRLMKVVMLWESSGMASLAPSFRLLFTRGRAVRTCARIALCVSVAQSTDGPSAGEPHPPPGRSARGWALSGLLVCRGSVAGATSRAQRRGVERCSRV